ncbi:MAG: hypothetical protein EBU01_02855 [Crocinitomicaceae bacterium]|nr:hypothetical protein [Crocinitomicaceae bacterium]NCA21289.1 hypothetical protein [Crocinitomicaceae bacterium]
MKNAFLIFSILTLASCQPIMKAIYGIKKPDIENQESITKKALKFGLDTTNIVSVTSKDFPYVLKSTSIPNAAIYDSNGKYIEYRQTDTSCNAGLFDFIPKLNLSGTYNKPDSSSLAEEWTKFRDLKGNEMTLPNNADFYLLIYWNVWTGKLNKDHVKIWEDLARENKNCKIKVIKVNLDIQEYWEPKEKEMYRKAMRKL